MAQHRLVVLTVVLSIVTMTLWLRYGWVEEIKVLCRVMATIALATPFAQFVIWLAYIKIRDALWGAFGSRKSYTRASVLVAFAFATSFAYLTIVTLATRLSIAAAFGAAGTIAWMSFAGAISLVALAKLSGPSEIIDTLWALLDIQQNSPNSHGEGTSAEPA